MNVEGAGGPFLPATSQPGRFIHSKTCRRASPVRDFILTNKVFRLTVLFFDVREEWTPAPKQRLGAVKKVNPQFYSLLEDFYKEEGAVEAKLEVAKKMVPLVFDR